MNPAGQRAYILRQLKAHGSVDARDLLLQHGIARAAARIHELRQEGYPIVTEPPRTLEDGRRTMASYRLVDAEPQQRALW